MSDQDPFGSTVRPKRPSTVLESVEEIRDQVRRARTVNESQTPSDTGDTDDDTLLFRPTHRPTMAVLYIFDDGSSEAEKFRLQGDSFTIGRLEGDHLIPHDEAVSGRHIEIARRFENNHFRWYLKDLNSSNGTFARVSRAIMSHGQELLVGSRTYRFEIATGTWGTGSVGRPSPSPSTRKVQPDSALPGESPATPALVEVSQSGGACRYKLEKAESTIGRAKSCDIVLNDPMVSPEHGRFRRDLKGRWHFENVGAINGTWLRIQEIAVDRSCYFQCGEQRFAIKIP